MFNVDIYTDGACSGNPGPGGYGAIITCKGQEKIVRGFVENSTNCRMELIAIIEAIKVLNKPCQIQVYTDAKYVVDGVNNCKKWLAKKDLANRDLWMELITIGNEGKHKMKFIKVKGHSGDVMNERCDKIAKEQIRKYWHERTGMQ